MADLSALENIASRLACYQACIFISANAVQSAWPTLTARQPWPESLTAAVVGPGTAQVLRRLDVTRIVLPQAQFDSESLLALPLFRPDLCEGRAFALIRGEGGRDLIARALRERGARVDEACTYERSLDSGAVSSVQELLLRECVAKDRLSAMIVTSSESLERFMKATPPPLAQTIRNMHIIAPHERIALLARSLGFEKVTVCGGGDDGILKFLQTYNGSSSTDEPGMEAQ